MKLTLLFLFFIIHSNCKTLIFKPENASGKPITVVWIQGMLCSPQAYEKIIKVFQQNAASKGLSAYVGVPEMIFNAPNPAVFQSYVEAAEKDLVNAGGSGKMYMAAHSVGGVFSQQYLQTNTHKYSGLLLMGSVLLRTMRDIESDGKTKFNFQLPVLTITGTKDGLMRVTRAAESYWHSDVNVVSSQANMYPTITIDGVSHACFMDNANLPSFVKDNDLKADVTQASAYNTITSAMIDFIQKRGGGQVYQDTKIILQPLIDGMVMEGSYALKPPSYQSPLVNPKDITKLQGSPFTAQVTQRMMGGDLQNSKITLHNTDNFHRVQSVTPVHLAQINNTCDFHKQVNCVLETVTVTENLYNKLDPLDTGISPIAATEMKCKLMSRQAIQQAIGDADSDYTVDDVEGSRCGEINQESLNWALSKASSTALANYNKYGKKLVIGKDVHPGPGPAWIWDIMSYKDNSAKTQTTISSPAMSTPTDFKIKASAGFHYCKILSPFKALEWIYIDGLYDHNGIKNSEEQIIEKEKGWLELQMFKLD